MKTQTSYRSLIFICTFLTGMTGLIFQVAWQKYLSYLIGSEARSMSLVVAVFLLGLASGYRYWGKLSAKITERYQLLKLYGYIELGIGAFAIVFPRYYHLLEKISHNSPNHLGSDLIVALLAIFIPTFLMGATVPLLTAVIPERADEVNSIHARVYGINTLGAVIGALGGGFLFIPWLGLSMSLVVGGFLNVIVGLVLGANQLEGSIQEKGEIESLPHRFGNKTIYAFVFITGCVSISFELLFIRIMNLTVGSGYYVFPMVVGIFVLGLAIGSLSLYRKPITLNRVFKEMLFLLGYLSVVYLTTPYWPYWLHNVRASLTSVPTNYVVYMIMVTMFLSLFCLPFLIPLGRLLPVGYSLIPKDNKNYGRVCGYIYFINSIGTLVGSLFLGHYLLNWLNLDHVFKIVLLMFAGMLLFMLTKQGHHKKIAAGAVLAIVALLLPKWNRHNHEVGLFRDLQPKDYSFKGIFKIPGYGEPRNILFFDDDPNTTVTALREPIKENGKDIDSLTIVVNGKSDSNTFGDHSTITLLATIPYMHLSKDNLSAAVVGLGTGVSAGILGAAKDIKDVTVLEISPKLALTAPIFDAYTENMSKNPKVQVIESDAFRYFTKTEKKFDLILSEPSNPWVTGVENLFTPKFYETVKKSMTEDGVFMQWTHLYSMNGVILATILDNLSASFPYLQLYAIGTGDLGILASMKPIQSTRLQSRWNEDVIRKRHEQAALYDSRELDLLRLYSEKELNWIGKTLSEYPHDIDRPTLAYLSSWSFFLDQRVDPENLILNDMARLIRSGTGETIAPSLRALAAEYRNGVQGCGGFIGKQRKFACDRISVLTKKYNAWMAADKKVLNIEVLGLYRDLRQKGLIPADVNYLHQLASQISAPVKIDANLGLMLAHELAKEQQWEESKKVITVLIEAKLIPQDQISQVQARWNATRNLITTSMNEFSALRP